LALVEEDCCKGRVSGQLSCEKISLEVNFCLSLQNLLCKEGASVVTHFGSPRKKRENTKKLLNEKIKNKKIKK